MAGDSLVRHRVCFSPAATLLTASGMPTSRGNCIANWQGTMLSPEMVVHADNVDGACCMEQDIDLAEMLQLGNALIIACRCLHMGQPSVHGPAK